MTKPAPPRSHRWESIDQLRGLMIFLMVLGHARFFLSPTPFHPDDPQRSTIAYGLLRWATHFCAPAFLVLTGISSHLRASRVGPGAQTWFLVRRGVLLILLEATLVNLSWHANYDFVLFQILWITGAGMVFLAGFSWLPRPLGLATALLPMFSHNLLDTLSLPIPSRIATLLHAPGSIRILGQSFVVLYPLLPWLFVIPLGFCLGTWYDLPARERRMRLLGWGGAGLGLFALLRLVDRYGDPIHWSGQGGVVSERIMWFMCLTKYPASLQYLSLTLGGTLVLLAVLERWNVPAGWVLARFGRHPLLVYLVHLPLLHVAGRLWLGEAYSAVPDSFTGFFPDDYQPSMGRLAVAWILLMAIIFFALGWIESRRRNGRQAR